MCVCRAPRAVGIFKAVRAFLLFSQYPHAKVIVADMVPNAPPDGHWNKSLETRKLTQSLNVAVIQSPSEQWLFGAMRLILVLSLETHRYISHVAFLQHSQSILRPLPLNDLRCPNVQ